MGWLVPILLPVFRELLVALAPLLMEIIRAGVQDTVEVGVAPDDLVERLRAGLRDAGHPDPARSASAIAGTVAGEGVGVRRQTGAGTG